MDFFGIGAPELALILIVLFILFGPSRLPEIAGTMGKAMRKLKQASAEVNRNLRELSDQLVETGNEAKKVVSDEKGVLTELGDVRRELGDAAHDIRDSTRITPGLRNDLNAIAGDISSTGREVADREGKQGEPARNVGIQSRS